MESKTGKLHTLEGPAPKDVSFKIVGNQTVDLYVDALKSDQIKLNILKEMALGITGKQYLKRILIVGQEGKKSSQGKLFK